MSLITVPMNDVIYISNGTYTIIQLSEYDINLYKWNVHNTKADTTIYLCIIQQNTSNDSNKMSDINQALCSTLFHKRQHNKLINITLDDICGLDYMLITTMLNNTSISDKSSCMDTNQNDIDNDEYEDNIYDYTQDRCNGYDSY